MNNLKKVIDKSIKKYDNSRIRFEVNNDRELLGDILKILQDRGYVWSNDNLPTEFMPSPRIYSLDLNLNSSDNIITYSNKNLDWEGLNYVKYDELKRAQKKIPHKIIKDVENDNVNNILILEPFVVAYFTDGDIFVACCDDEDEFNENVGIAICKTKKMIKDEKEKMEKLKEEMKFSERRIKFGRDYLKEVNE